jgi:ferredoxin
MSQVDESKADSVSLIDEEVSLMPNNDVEGTVAAVQDRRDRSIVTLSKAAMDENEIETAVIGLRRYHLGDPEAGKQCAQVPDDVLPALLDPYRGRSGIRYEYPLYLPGPGNVADSPLARPLGEFLADAVEIFAPGAAGARMLRDNLPRVERYIDRKLKNETNPVDAGSLLVEATVALQDEIDLDDDNRDRMQQDLDKLNESLEAGSQFLGYGPYVAIHLLKLAVHNHSYIHRAQFVSEVEERIRGLSELLAVEKEKSAAALEPASVQQKVGTASRYFDSKALSGVMEHRTQGSIIMPAERKDRIEQVLETLRGYDANSEEIQFVAEENSPWLSGDHAYTITYSDDPCASAKLLYEELAGTFSRVFAAFRIAQLEIDGVYESSIHDSWFENFDWEAFSANELLLIPTIVALVTAENIAGDGMLSLSRLLNSRKPIQVLAWVEAHSNPGAPKGEDQLQSIRTELSYFGLGQRQANLVQSSASRHEHLLNGLQVALSNSRTSLYLISTEFTHGEEAPLDPWMMSSAAMESRAHPFFQVNRGSGDEEDEVSFEGNTQPGNDWSLNVFAYQDGQGVKVETELAFTFADYCLLKPSLKEHFRLVPPGCESEDLVGAAAYLDSSIEKPERAVPYVWGIDESGLLHQIVVSRALMLASRDRQNYWRSLQAQCGIRNKYVEQARQEVRAEERASAAEERDKLVSEYDSELERVREEATRDVMGHLADVLVGLDSSALVSGAGSAATGERADVPAVPDQAAPAEEEAEAAVAEPEVAEEDDISFDEPWIDSILCTTCDDCMVISKLLFVYNDDKQAYIPDAKLGTYAELVKAAEACPARCIHPGKPLDPSESGLEELILRAEPFN